MELPEIPSKTLKDPSSLAYDGSSFYIADWMGGGLLKLSPGAAPQWIALTIRPIQAAAVGKERLLIENDEGKLFYWTSGSKGRIKELPAPPRAPGAPYCWDGAYVWLVMENGIQAAALLGDSHLSLIPGALRTIENYLIPGASARGLACGWNRSALFLEYAGQEKTIPERHGILAGVLQKERPEAFNWERDGSFPAAIALSSGTLITLERKNEGSYALIPWRELEP